MTLACSKKKKVLSSKCNSGKTFLIQYISLYSVQSLEHGSHKEDGSALGQTDQIWAMHDSMYHLRNFLILTMSHFFWSREMFSTTRVIRESPPSQIQKTLLHCYVAYCAFS